jgi:CheY-like chemotaxis protein
MTANVLPEQVRMCLDAGMDGHVGKPFRPDDLIRAITEAVGREDAEAHGKRARG